ncbi:MAG: DUF2062 domain-containing protein [Gammaproteobacteria bacterium]|nr:MAG: DUF2062 domain-containing protein [Gammaproteobacteria bacterium]
MPKKFLKKHFPSAESIKTHKYLAKFGDKFHDPNLWHLNRRSVSGAFANGLFLAWVPVPLQMVLATISGIYFRVNLPISVGLVWITNPFTIPPMYYGAYKLGLWVMGQSGNNMEFKVNISYIMDSFAIIWQPFLLGCFIIGASSAIVGYVSIRVIWRIYIIRKIKKRK